MRPSSPRHQNQAKISQKIKLQAKITDENRCKNSQTNLIKEIKKIMPERKVLVSVFTVGGYNMAKQILSEADAVLSLFGNQLFAHIGTCTNANIQLANRLTHNTKKRSPAYSPAVSGERNTAKNVDTAIIVAPKRGIAVLRPILNR